jgi:hypothetical protein
MLQWEKWMMLKEDRFPDSKIRKTRLNSQLVLKVDQERLEERESSEFQLMLQS